VDADALARQLRALDVRITLARAGDTSQGDLALLSLSRDRLRRQVAARLATDPRTEDLARAVAEAVIGAMDADEAGAAIAQHGAALVSVAGQVGDVTVGDVAGGHIIKVYVNTT
jgi:hypothetical protein